MTEIFYSDGEAETRALGARLAPKLVPDGVLLLRGDLGSGKTVLTQGLAAGLGIDPRRVQSPSFTLVGEHQGSKGRLVHVDLYRIAPEEVEALGLWEVLAGPGVKVVEWSERLPYAVPESLEVVILQEGAADRRKIILRDRGGVDAPDHPNRVEKDGR